MHHVLVIEDNYALRRLYVRNLVKAGFTAQATSCLRDVPQKIEDTPPDVIISDIELADGNALDLITDLHNAGYPVIAISSDGHYKRAVQQIGVEDFLPKPILARTLIGSAKNILKRAQSSA